MGFSRSELEALRDTEVPDLLPEDLRLLLVGINPSLWTAATGAPFAHPGNRFYPALHAAGITAYRIDASAGYSTADVTELLGRGIGITNLSRRATARADELSPEELRDGADRLDALVAERRPSVVAMLGVTAYRVAFRTPRATTGKQEERWPGVELWVAPNPSGLNAHATTATLARDYREIAERAGLDLAG
ncbi:mismatch-specific DNA-glycosylase [Zhihengliuella sp.]|uniref:mismatch-specific DNA-glycosylase n=1 Tax=Zhihengliuella sp. TaxID=1954483 RepID=UPI00281224C7|nr:mismatch-specific DNA-glycosylase [Zhihengliuella sp.]